MGTAFMGDPDTNSYYHYESEKALSSTDGTGEPPADVADFVGRESR